MKEPVAPFNGLFKGQGIPQIPESQLYFQPVQGRVLGVTGQDPNLAASVKAVTTARPTKPVPPVTKVLVILL